jgi:glutamate---cysteine ligase / carboxylate-amine ligase
MENSRGPRTVGVEEEFLLVSADAPTLAPRGEAVVEAAEAGSSGQFEVELKREQAELGTSPQESMSELRRDLGLRRAQLALAAAQQGSRLLATGTSILEQGATTTAGERYERMTDEFGRVARIQLTCGMHVHVSVDSAAEGVGVLDRLRGWLPVITALSANSPYLCGDDTGYSSYRTVLWGQWPTAGSTEPFGDVAGYERARQQLVSSGAALDDGMIYFDARLSARYPTVEIRVADVCLEVDDAITIAAVARALVSSAATDWAADVPVRPIRTELLRAATWRAARWGTEQNLVDVDTAQAVPAWDLIDGVHELVAPALTAVGDDRLVRDGLARIKGRGTGSRFQREAFAANGAAGLIDAVAKRTLSSAHD